MIRVFQLRWLDEQSWKTVRELKPYEDEASVIRAAVHKQESDVAKYPKVPLAEFRVIPLARLAPQ